VKILVDSCVWSLALRRRPGPALKPEEEQLRRTLREAIEEGRVAMIGPIRQELLSGVRDPAGFASLRLALMAFPDEALTGEDFEEAAACYNLCKDRGKDRGLICGPIDPLVCATALRRDWPIVTSDLMLKRCHETIQSAARSRESKPAQ
jgi:predicted nucleic acid-binding protein